MYLATGHKFIINLRFTIYNWAGYNDSRTCETVASEMPDLGNFLWMWVFYVDFVSLENFISSVEEMG